MIDQNKGERLTQDEFKLDYALRYNALDVTAEIFPDEDEKKIVIQIAEEVNGKPELIGQTRIRQLEVKYGWDKGKKETSKNPEKRLKVKVKTCTIMVKTLDGFEYTLAQLIEDDRQLTDQIVEKYTKLVECNEVDVEETNLKPFKAIIRYLPEVDQGEIINRTLRPRGEYDPGTISGNEGSNDKKYTYALARRTIKSFEGLYDPEGKEITYDGSVEKPDLEALYEFIERNSALVSDITDFATNMRSQQRKQKKI